MFCRYAIDVLGLIILEDRTILIISFGVTGLNWTFSSLARSSISSISKETCNLYFSS